MALRGGSQCGYCTPGFICSMAAEYYRADRRAADRPRRRPEHGPNGFDLHAMSGNLCRCTGYRPIRDAAYALGRARRRRSVRACAAPSPHRPIGDPTRNRRRGVRPASRPRRGPRLIAPAIPTPSSSPARPTGVSRSTSADAGRRSWWPSTRSRSCARCRSTTDAFKLGAALTLTEMERRLDGPSRCSTRCCRSSRRD